MPFPRIDLTVDAAIFGFNITTGLSILLAKRTESPFKNLWALPGGFVLENETLEEAVTRKIKDDTGLELNYLEQLYTFGNPKRDPRKRVVSVAYFALVNPEKLKVVIENRNQPITKWYNINQVPKLAFDHNDIISTAQKRLQAKVFYEPIGFELLDEEFPFSHLQSLYEAISNRQIDRRNFHKKFMALDILKEQNLLLPNGKGRPAKTYSFDKAKYFKLKKQGIVFEI